MKGSRWFIIFIVVFLLVMFAVEYHLPKKFVWKPTFGHYDKQPFGCEVFDSLLSSSLPHIHAARICAVEEKFLSVGTRGYGRTV